MTDTHKQRCSTDNFPEKRRISADKEVFRTVWRRVDVVPVAVVVCWIPRLLLVMVLRQFQNLPRSSVGVLENRDKWNQNRRSERRCSVISPVLVGSKLLVSDVVKYCLLALDSNFRRNPIAMWRATIFLLSRSPEWPRIFTDGDRDSSMIFAALHRFPILIGRGKALEKCFYFM